MRVNENSLEGSARVELQSDQSGTECDNWNMLAVMTIVSTELDYAYVLTRAYMYIIIYHTTGWIGQSFQFT